MKSIIDASEPLLYRGREYSISFDKGAHINEIEGLVGDYHTSLESACAKPVSVAGGYARGYLYDSETDISDCHSILVNNKLHNSLEKYQLQDNLFDLVATDMPGPEIISNRQQAQLGMQVKFHLRYNTNAYPAQLGVTHLVQSQRFLSLENGSTIQLLDTPGWVLYLPDMVSTRPVHLICSEQGKDMDEYHDYHLTLRQTIPDQYQEITVESVTVLEQYKSYFMQRERSDSAERVIWTPLLEAVNWGWSIRVGYRADGELGILRRKLMLPAVGNDGLELPQWQTNHLAHYRPIWS